MKTRFQFLVFLSLLAFLHSEGIAPRLPNEGGGSGIKMASFGVT